MQWLKLKISLSFNPCFNSDQKRFVSRSKRRFWFFAAQMHENHRLFFVFLKRFVTTFQPSTCETTIIINLFISTFLLYACLSFIWRNLLISQVCRTSWVAGGDSGLLRHAFATYYKLFFIWLCNLYIYVYQKRNTRARLTLTWNIINNMSTRGAVELRQTLLSVCSQSHLRCSREEVNESPIK